MPSMVQSLMGQEEFLMRVAELKKGDMLYPAPGMMFIVATYAFSDNDPWLRVSETKVWQRTNQRIWKSSKPPIPKDTQFMIYLGTKKDTGATTTWSNRFCLLDNRVVAIEPSCWKWIQKSD